MNNTQRGGGKVRNNYHRAVVLKRRRVTHITPAGVFFRRIGNKLDRNMGTLLGVAAASVFVTLLAGIVAFATVILPDRSGVIRVTVPDFCGSVYSDGSVDTELFDVSIEYKFDGSSPAGTVISQYPARAGRMVGERRCTDTYQPRARYNYPPPTRRKTAPRPSLSCGHWAEVSIVQKHSVTAQAGTVISTPASILRPALGSHRHTLSASGRSLSMWWCLRLRSGRDRGDNQLLSAGLLVNETEYVKSSKPASIVIAQSEPSVAASGRHQSISHCQPRRRIALPLFPADTAGKIPNKGMVIWLI